MFVRDSFGVPLGFVYDSIDGSLGIRLKYYLTVRLSYVYDSIFYMILYA